MEGFFEVSEVDFSLLSICEILKEVHDPLLKRGKVDLRKKEFKWFNVSSKYLPCVCIEHSCFRNVHKSHL